MGLKDAAESIAKEKAEKESSGTDRIRELLGQIEPKIEQVHQLYRQFFSGVEKRPPKVAHDQLLQLLTSLKAIQKPTPALRFQAETLIARYTSYQTQWDKMLKQQESGKKR